MQCKRRRPILITLHRYINTITERQQRYPPPDFRGGLLADQMGLGKTLTMIALITSNVARLPRKRPRHPRCQAQEVKSTLVVVPLSRKSPLGHPYQGGFHNPNANSNIVMDTWEGQLHR